LFGEPNLSVDDNIEIFKKCSAIYNVIRTFSANLVGNPSVVPASNRNLHLLLSCSFLKKYVNVI
jgi:hypothetical protein